MCDAISGRAKYFRYFRYFGYLEYFLGTFSTFRYLKFIWYLVDDESTCISEGMTVTFQCGEIVLFYILLIIIV